MKAKAEKKTGKTDAQRVLREQQAKEREEAHRREVEELARQVRAAKKTAVAADRGAKATKPVPKKKPK